VTPREFGYLMGKVTVVLMKLFVLAAAFKYLVSG
jgi:hypothetical protein